MIAITDDDRRELHRIRDKVDGMRGDGVKNTHNAICITQTPATGRRSPSSPPSPFKLPPPGLPRQVLQLDDNKNAVWDWVQTP